MDCADLPIFCQFDGDILLPFGSSEYMGMTSEFVSLRAEDLVQVSVLWWLVCCF